MHIRNLHSWDMSVAEATALQQQMADQIDVSTPLTRWDLIAGADVAYDRLSSTVYAGVVVFRVSDGLIVEKQGAVHETSFPYVPGLFSFRDAPALLKALAQVQAEPDVVMLDGQGLAHPRRFGLACHVGLWLDRPCLGCAKSRLLFSWQFKLWDGPMPYWLITTGPDGTMGINGGLMKRQHPVTGNDGVIAYVCTVGVDDLDKSFTRGVELGATVALPRMPIPGVGWLAYLKDPEGNVFGLMQSDPAAK
jgi:predicted enzyme related to lactoylglutathione lyase